MTSTLSKSIFRAYDIRGVVGENLTPDIVYDIARAIGSQAQEQGEKTFAIARDGRLSGPLLFPALSQGLRECGCDVIDLGAIPTPVLYFATYILPARSGVMLTGSHNPADYNGLKMVINRGALAEKSIEALYERTQTKNFRVGQGKLQSYSIIPDYIQRIKQDVKCARKLRVVVDCGNGITGNVAPELFRQLGCDVIELFCEVDGRFPHHHPDPSVPENLQDLMNAVKTHQADLGLAFDGDGDRLGVVTPQGKIIWPDRQLMLFAIDVLSRNPHSLIIYDVKCSSHLAQVIEQHSGQPFMWKTGHSFIKAKLQETGAPLAGEMSGHIFFKERWYGFDDGLYAAARLLEILTATSLSADDLFATLPDSVNTPELKIVLPEERKFIFMEELKARSKFPDGKITTIDGIRVDFAYGWGLVRSSNTTPCLVLRFEADSSHNLTHIQDVFRRELLALDPHLEVPF